MGQTFQGWMKQVDYVVSKKYKGLSVDDLADCCFADWYEAGMASSTAAMKAVKANGGAWA
jgi:hypothetical protein